MNLPGIDPPAIKPVCRHLLPIPTCAPVPHSIISPSVYVQPSFTDPSARRTTEPSRSSICFFFSRFLLGLFTCEVNFSSTCSVCESCFSVQTFMNWASHEWREVSDSSVGGADPSRATVRVQSTQNSKTKTRWEIYIFFKLWQHFTTFKTLCFQLNITTYSLWMQLSFIQGLISPNTQFGALTGAGLSPTSCFIIIQKSIHFVSLHPRER